MGSDDPPPPGPPAESDDEKVIDLGVPSSGHRHTPGRLRDTPGRLRHTPGRLRLRVVVGIAILAVGGIVGYAISDSNGSGVAAHHPTERSEAAAANPVDVTGQTCSMEHGTEHSVGVQLVNHAGHAIDLDKITVSLPAGSRFHVVAGFWGPCGTTSSLANRPPVTLGTGATTWVSATVASQVQCAIPDPVVFVIDYDRRHALRTQFSGLADGRYAGCGEPTGR